MTDPHTDIISHHEGPLSVQLLPTQKHTTPSKSQVYKISEADHSGTAESEVLKRESEGTAEERRLRRSFNSNFPLSTGGAWLPLLKLGEQLGSTTPVSQDFPTDRDQPITDEDLDPIPPDIARSQAAFREALPELLKKRHRQWVAIRDGEIIEFGRTRQKLERKLDRKNIGPEEVLVRCIIPDLPDDQVEISSYQ